MKFNIRFDRCQMIDDHSNTMKSYTSRDMISVLENNKHESHTNVHCQDPHRHTDTLKNLSITKTYCIL